MKFSFFNSTIALFLSMHQDSNMFNVTYFLQGKQVSIPVGCQPSACQLYMIHNEQVWTWWVRGGSVQWYSEVQVEWRGPCMAAFPAPQQNDRQDWKHYLPARLLAGDNYHSIFLLQLTTTSGERYSFQVQLWRFYKMRLYLRQEINMFGYKCSGKQLYILSIGWLAYASTYLLRKPLGVVGGSSSWSC